MSNKANQSAFNQLDKQATMVGAFEKTAQKNMNLAISLSNKVSRAGIPIFDRWVQSGRKMISGDPAVAQFHSANETFLNEYAKIMSGSMGNTPISDAARASAKEMLDSAYTKDQYMAVMSTLKKDMDNRMTGFIDQRNELSAKITGQSTPSVQTSNKPKVWNSAKGVWE